MIDCKVMVRVMVQVERQLYADDRPLPEIFRIVAGDAVSQIRREIGPHATIVGMPLVESVLTVAKEVEVKA